MSIKMSIRYTILCGLLMLHLCACGRNTQNNIFENVPASTEYNMSDENISTLENTINDTMTALKELDLDQLNANTNNRQIMVTPWGSKQIEYTMFGELSEKQYTDSGQELVYQLDREIVKNLSWEILDIRQETNTAKIKLRITNTNMKGIFQRIEQDEELIDEIRKIPFNDIKTVDLKLKAEKQNEKWILLIDVDFANAVTADIWVMDSADD